MRFLPRFWSVLVGLLMVAVSLSLQFCVFLILSGVVIPMLLTKLDPRMSFIGLLLLFNGVSCLENFRQRKCVGLGNWVHKLQGFATTDSRHISMGIFLLPRGLDRIFTGRELGS